MRKYLSAAVVATTLFGAALYYNQAPDALPEPPAPAPVPAMVPIASAQASDGLSLRATLSHPYEGLSLGQSEEAYLAVEVSAPEAAPSARAPMNIAIVLDRSGSMAGEKWSEARRSIEALLEHVETRDRVALITYGSEARTEFPLQSMNEYNKRALSTLTRSLSPGGGTNMADGMSDGFAALQDRVRPEALSRLVLISDGLPTMGMTHEPSLIALAKQKINAPSARRDDTPSVTTIGVGLDYNEDLMMGIANVGGGNYYFADGRRDLSASLKTELRAFSSIVARQARASVSIPAGWDVTALNLEGAHRAEGERVYFDVELGALPAGARRDVMLKLRRNAPGAAPGAASSWLVGLRHLGVEQGAVTEQSVRLVSIASADRERIRARVSQDVIVRAEQIASALASEEALRRYEARDARGAEKVLQEQRRRMSASQKRYRISPKKLKKTKGALITLGDEMKAKPEASSAPARRMRKRIKAKAREVRRESVATW